MTTDATRGRAAPRITAAAAAAAAARSTGRAIARLDIVSAGTSSSPRVNRRCRGSTPAATATAQRSRVTDTSRCSGPSRARTVSASLRTICRCGNEACTAAAAAAAAAESKGSIRPISACPTKAAWPTGSTSTGAAIYAIVFSSAVPSGAATVPVMADSQIRNATDAANAADGSVAITSASLSTCTASA
ncbi:hypothetical protein [Rhizorhabdus wittichii]|uniref:hypothetical protein n=1 Tax=Rhizorhabdus wittichii TaxID=160791 RepID=UPI00178C2C21|nr:hypothetical protein [Rhizorhabdus wittichii]